MKDVPQDLYETICKVTPIPGSLTYIVVGSEVLLLKRNVSPQFGYWAPPAGSMDMGETPKETALRELKEETDLELTGEQLSFLWSKTYFHPNRQDITFEYLARLCGKPDIKLDHENSTYGWFTRYDLPGLIDSIVKESIKEILK